MRGRVGCWQDTFGAFTNSALTKRQVLPVDFQARLILLKSARVEGDNVSKFEELLAAMPSVAKAVNSFQSEEVQKQAFETLVALFVGAKVQASPLVEPQQYEQATAQPQDEQLNADSVAAKKSKSRKAKQSQTRDQVEAVRHLDLRPSGKTSFIDFIAEKQPKSNQDKYAVAVYWLEQIGEVEPITLSHIAAIFKQTQGWREPNNLRVGLTTTATRKNTIDTSDVNNLKTTPAGRNFVEHDLPESK